MVKEFRKIVRILKRERMALFMPKNSDTDIPNYWNAIVSTPEYDSLTIKEALKHLWPAYFSSNLGREVLRRIIRLTVLKTDNKDEYLYR